MLQPAEPSILRCSPADAGCIVDNVETIIAVYNAVKNGQPVLKRISTVTGDAVKNPSNILYSIGTSYRGAG